MPFDFLARRKNAPHLEKLRRLQLFADLSTSELAIVASLLHLRQYVADEVIFDEGETGQAIYILLDGEIMIRRQGHPENGYLAKLGPGEFFGELALLDGSVRTAQALAGSDCRLAILFREDFNGLMESHLRIAHKIGRQLLRHLGHRLRELGLLVGSHRHL